MITRALLAALLALFPAQQDRFRQWDRNGDGKISREELPERIRRNFDRVDTDGDGFISRKEHEAVAARRRQPPAPEGVKTLKDLPYAETDNPRQRLDLFLPEKPKTEGPLPVIAFIHGGGWRNGSKDVGARRVAPFVATGKYAAASIGYRLSGEAKWPAQIHDCKAAIRWIRAHAKEHNLDPDRIAIWGSSAGGHLVSMLGVGGGIASLEGSLGPHTDVDSRVRCVANWYGPSDLLTMNDKPSRMDHNAPDSPESLLVGGSIQEHKEKARHASPLTHVSSDDATFLIMHGDKDPLVPHDQSVRLEAALKKAGVEVTFVTIKNGGHGFRGEEIDRRMQAFFEKHLLGANVEVSGETIEVAPK